MIWSSSARVLVLLFVSSVAFAQSAQDKAAAEALFRQGRDLAKQGKFVEACARFESSHKLDPSSGTLLNLADCYEKLGRTASAWVTFEDASRLARSRGETQKSTEAGKRARALEAKLPRLTVEVPASSRVAGLEIRRDDTVVPEGTWGIPVPIDPGSHRLRATAPNRTEWVHELAVQEAANASVTVPPLRDKNARPTPPVETRPAPTPQPPPEAKPPAAQPAETPEPVPPVAPEGEGDGGGGSAARTAAPYVGGLGIILAVTGIYYGIQASKVATEVEEHRGEWDAEAQALEDKGERDQLISYVFVGGGIVAVGIAVALYVSGGSSSSAAATPSTTVSATPMPGGGIVVLGASF
jgi:tetratricopeptide (TPR) repeat protein